MLAIGEKQLATTKNESYTGGFDAAGGAGRYLHPMALVHQCIVVQT